MRLFGPASAVTILLLGVVAVSRASTPKEAVVAVGGLGTLLTLVAGLLSALWWHQSASLSSRVGKEDLSRRQSQEDANVLNGAAATTTGLALIGSVFSNLSWASFEGALGGAAFLLLLAMSGSEIWTASALSVRHGLRSRSVLTLAVMILASLLFIVRWVVR